MAEITTTGVVGKSLNEYLVDLQGRYIAIDPNWNIGNDSPDGQVIGIQAEMLTNLDEGVVAAYRSNDPDSATGEALNNIGKISGVLRKAATYSVAPITVTGTSGTIIPASTSQVRSSADNSVWTVNASIAIGVGGSATGFVTCTTSGRVNAGPGELSVIGTNISGWASVTNPTAATVGEEQETNAAFRVRRENSVSLAGSNMVDNMYAAIANVEGVTDVKVYENDLDTTSSIGLPPHSIGVVVNGGTQAEIGYAMYTKKNPGAGMYPRWNPDTDTWIDTLTNGVKVDVTSPVTGNVAPMTYQVAIALQIYVRVQITKIGTLPSNIADLINAAILADSSKTLFEDDGTTTGFNRGGYDIGEVVPVGRLYTPVNKVLGVYGDSYVNSLTIGTSAGSLGQTPIQPAYNQLATFDADNIVVVVS